MSMNMNGDIIIYEFSRSAVEQGDFTHFLERFRAEKLPSGTPLRQMMDSMVFVIEGYDDDPREIHTIPEIRKFYQALHHAWPYWLYFCNLDQDGLKMMTLCCLESITAIKVDGNPDCAVQYNPIELIKSISEDFVHMNVMCEQAGMTERGIYDRSKHVMEYFGFPYDVPPPAE